MEKDFDKWNEFKKKLEKQDKKLIFKEWEIWWTSIWLNTKAESCWKWPEFRRPVLIIKKLSHSTCIIIPLSTKIKNGTWFANYEINGIKYTALLYQIKMLHINRFTKRELKLNKESFNSIKKKLKKLLNF